MSTICEACRVWLLQPEFDHYCGWCGSPLLEVSLLREDGEPLGARDYLRPGDKQRVYLLRQRGAACNGAPEVVCDEGQCSVSAADEPGLYRLTVACGYSPQPVELTLRIGSPQVARKLTLWPVPEIQPLPDPSGLQIRHRKRFEAAFVDARAAVERLLIRVSAQGAPLLPRRIGLLTDARSEPVWGHEGTLVTDGLTLRLLDLEREVGLERQLQIQIERRSIWPRGQSRRLTLVVELDGLPRWELPLELVQRQRVGGDLQPETCEFDVATLGRIGCRAGHFNNGDDFPLTITGVTSDVPWVRVTEYEPSLRAEELRPLPCPAALAPEVGLDFNVLVDANHPLFPSDQAGELFATVRFELDRPPHRRELALRIGRAAPAASLAQKGYLAIDFGTTNTCCALKLEDREVEMIPFGADGRTSIASVIFFEDLSDAGKPRLRIGQPALERARRHSERSLVRNFKRRIGLETREQVVDPEGRGAAFLPEQLAGLFLAEVLREVREFLDGRGAPIEVDAIFFTYPVLFSPRQVEILSQVFRDLGVRDVRPAMDEASAGSVRYLHGWANAAYRKQPEAPKRTEYVLNYDFGGGTIDIALLEVVTDFSGQLVRSTPIGVTGLYRFGGEDITVLVRQMIVRRIERAMRRRHPRFSLPCGDLSDPPGLYEPKKHNNARLNFLAEKAKIAIFSSGSYTIHPGDEELDDLWVDLGDGAGLEQADADQRPVLSGLDLQDARITLRIEEVERVIRPQVAGSIERAYNLWRFSGKMTANPGGGLARVLLTGRSSSIPLVRKLMAERLSLDDEQIVHDPRSAKEVVAEGACYYRRLWSILVTGLRFQLGEANARTLIPIGIEKIDFSESVFHPVFANGAELEQRDASDGQRCWFIERQLRLRLCGPIASLKVFRSLDYVDPITSGGKDLIARFEFRADDPFFVDWTQAQRDDFPVQFQLWKSLDGGAQRLELVVTHPTSGAQKVFRSLFQDDLLATVDEAEEARGSFFEALDRLPGEAKLAP